MVVKEVVSFSWNPVASRELYDTSGARICRRDASILSGVHKIGKQAHYLARDKCCSHHVLSASTSSVSPGAQLFSRRACTRGFFVSKSVAIFFSRSEV